LRRHLMGADQNGRHLSGLLIRRKHKEFNELRRHIDALIAQGMPAERIGGDQQIIHIRFTKAAEIILAAIMRIKQFTDWPMTGLAILSIDE
jgi:hypothetical protein